MSPPSSRKGGTGGATGTIKVDAGLVGVSALSMESVKALVDSLVKQAQANFRPTFARPAQ